MERAHLVTRRAATGNNRRKKSVQGPPHALAPVIPHKPLKRVKRGSTVDWRRGGKASEQVLQEERLPRVRKGKGEQRVTAAGQAGVTCVAEEA